MQDNFSEVILKPFQLLFVNYKFNLAGLLNVQVYSSDTYPSTSG